MSGMLSAIEARLARFASTVNKTKETAMEQVQHGKRGESKKYEVPEDGKGKVVGVLVPAHLYARLVRLQQKLGVKTLKETVLRALEAGVSALGE